MESGARAGSDRTNLRPAEIVPPTVIGPDHLRSTPPYTSPR